MVGSLLQGQELILLWEFVMLAEKKVDIEPSEPVSENQVLGQILSSPSDAVAIGKTLPEEQRARIAQFCYNRVHMRELGLRLASTCDIVTLRNAFGRAADVVYKQSRDVDETLGKLKSSGAHHQPKPVTLKGSITG